MQNIFDVAVVGGGPAGSAMASVLKQKGLDVILLDRGVGIAPANHAVALQPNGLSALAEMGALDDVMKGGQKIAAVQMYNEHRHLLASVDTGQLELPYPFIVVALPDRLTRLFRDRFIADSGHMLEGFEFKSLLKEGGAVKGVSGVIDGQPREIRARLVIGADGPFSKVRETSGLSYRVNRYKDTQMVLVLPGAVRGVTSRVILGNGVMLGAATIGAEVTYYFCYMSQKEIDRYKKEGLEQLKKRIVELDPEIQPPLEALQEWRQVAVVKAIGVFMESWTLPGLALIGDAAHAMDPWLAQGMNQTLLDILTLGKVLEECKKRDDFSHEAVKKYEQLRLSQATFYGKQSQLGARFFVPRNWFYHWIATRSVRRIGKYRRPREFVLRLAAGQLTKAGKRDTLSLLI